MLESGTRELRSLGPAPRFQRSSQHRGVALITAMLVTALASMMAISLAANQQLEIRRTGNVLDSDRAYAFALGVEGWVKHVLDRDDRKKDSLDEDWAMTLPPIPVEGGTVSGRIEDMQGRFNVNNLVRRDGQRSKADFEYFQRLLESLGLNPDLALAALDWIDADMDANFGGAEDDDYLSAEAPYRAANRPLTSASELLLIKGFTREVYDTLAPYVTALPVRTPVNVNTAAAPVLAALVEGLTPADAQFIVERRAEKSFERLEEFINQDEVRGKSQIPANMADVKSEFFMLNAVTQFGQRAKVNLYSLITRRGNKVAVLMRAQGVF